MQRLLIRIGDHIADALDVPSARLHQATQVHARLCTTCSRSCHKERIELVERTIEALRYLMWRPALMKSTPIMLYVVGCGTSSPLILNDLARLSKVTKQN
jgi:hypothetical protein